jgi:hypothetical protein
VVQLLQQAHFDEKGGLWTFAAGEKTSVQNQFSGHKSTVRFSMRTYGTKDSSMPNSRVFATQPRTATQEPGNVLVCYQMRNDVHIMDLNACDQPPTGRSQGWCGITKKDCVLSSGDAKRVPCLPQVIFP